MKVTLTLSGISEKDFDTVVEDVVNTIKVYHEVGIFVGIGEPEESDNEEQKEN